MSHFHRDPATFLEELVKIPSVSGSEGAAAAWLVSRMSDLRYDEAFVDGAGSPTGILGQGQKTLILLGHIDTVPGDVPVRRTPGRLYGRGTVDAKGPLAAFTLAAAAVGPREGWRIVVVGAVEEESATARGARAAAELYRPEACIIGEPSSWQKLCVGYKGRLLVDCRLTRPLTHTAGRERGGCEDMVDFWNRISQLATSLNTGATRIFEQLSPSLRSMRSQNDGLLETVEARIGLRLPPGLKVAEVESSLGKLASLTRKGLSRSDATIDESGEIELSFSGREEAFRAGKSNPLVRAFLQAIRDEDGTPGFVVKTGTSDMNLVGPAWGCPILAYGPGDSSLDHTPDEHIEIAELESSIGVLGRAIRQLTSSPS